MKRYVRTKDGTIINSEWTGVEDAYFLIKNHGGILKTADTIEELIMVGDLTNKGFITCVYKDKTFGSSSGLIYFEDITELYTKKVISIFLSGLKRSDLK